MPMSRPELRDKFFTWLKDEVNGTDGIMECEEIITKAGGKVLQGMITVPPKENMTTEIGEAIEYLTDEWDYDYQY